MLTIEMKPVKFGDCFILSEDLNYLIVDCGSANRSGGLKRSEFAYSQISNLIKNKNLKLDLLITHFDSDHYNGILEIKGKKFENIYFPYCFMDKNNEFCSTIAHLILLNSNITCKSVSRDLVKLLIKLPEIILNYGKLFSLYSGHPNFSLRTHQFNVIWPPKGQPIYQNPYQKKLNWALEYLNNQFSETIQPLAKSLRKFFDALYEENSLGIEQINEHTKSIKDEYKKLLNERRGNLRNRTNYNAIKNYIRIARHYLINEMNACSIIFSHEKKLIFFGDATKEIIEHLRQSKIIDSYYKIVKIQHHGTERYFTPSTPDAKYYLISNGGYKSRKVSEKFIINKKADEIYCSCCNISNDYCNYLGRCPKNCSCGYNCRCGYVIKSV